MNKRANNIAFFFLAAIVIIGGAYFLITGISLRKETNETIKKCIEKTTAKVVGPEKEKKVGTSKFPHMMYQAGLEIPDREYILMSPWSDKKFTLNSTIEVFYDPTSPDTLYIPSNPHFSASEARRDIIEGIISILLGILCSFGKIRQMKKEGIL